MVLTPGLKECWASTLGVGSHSRRYGRLGKVLVISQVAISLLLLIGAGLFVRTLTNLQNEDLGFDHRNLVLFGINPTQSSYKGEKLVAFYQELQRRIEAIPGVRSASLSRHTLVSGGVTIDGVAIHLKPRTECKQTIHLDRGDGAVGFRAYIEQKVPILAHDVHQ